MQEKMHSVTESLLSNKPHLKSLTASFKTNKKSDIYELKQYTTIINNVKPVKSWIDGSIHPNNMDLETLSEKRHYIPSYKEWQTSEYSYNKNATKLSPIVNTVLFNVIKGYFNSNALENNKKSSRIKIRFQRLSLNRILVSNPEIKQTNNKIVITVYVYNGRKKYLNFKLDKLENKVKAKGKRIQKKLNLRVKTKYSIKREKPSYLKKINKVSLIKKQILKGVKMKPLIGKKSGLRINNTINISKNGHKSLFIKALDYDKKNLDLRYNKTYKSYIEKLYKKKILYSYYTKMLFINNNLFKNWYLLGVKNILSRLCKKETELNIINMKYFHLNTDNFTQAIVIKLRNRSNKLLKVLKKAIKLVRLPSRSVLSFSQPELSVNTNYTFFPFISNEEDIISKVRFVDNARYGIIQSVLNTIKYKAVSGVRLEAAGRLSRRLTASRSVFKYKYKGSLRDKDTYTKSSYDKASSTVSRGHMKPNTQYTYLKSKTRNGAFGLKGWMSTH